MGEGVHGAADGGSRELFVSQEDLQVAWDWGALEQGVLWEGVKTGHQGQREARGRGELMAFQTGSR